MAEISAKGVKFIYGKKEVIDVFYKVGNCKLTDKDIDTLLQLRETCREHPTGTVDCRPITNHK